MRQIGFFALAIVAAAPTVLSGDSKLCQAPPKPGEVTAFTYLSTIVDSLAQVHEALGAINATAESASLTAKMTSTKNAIAETNLAIVRLGDVAGAKGENAKGALKGIGTAYLTILRSLGLQRSAYEKLDAATKTEDLAGVRSIASDAGMLYQQSTKLLYDGAKLAFLSTMVPDPRDPANRTVMDMSEAERMALLALIESSFGSDVKNVNSTQTGPMQAAGLIYIGVARQRPRPR